MQLILAIGIPWWLGYLLVQLLIGNNKPGKTLIAVGYGYFIGCLIVVCLCAAFSISSHLNAMLSIVLMLIINITLSLYLRGKKAYTVAIAKEKPGCPTKLNKPIKIIAIFCLIWLITRLTSLGAEIVLQPLYPWDAYTSWIPKARLWFLSNEFVPVIDNWAWMRGLGISEEVYSHHSARERNYLSYLTLWHSLAIGRWDEGLSLLPWLIAIVAFLSAVAGQLMEAGLPKPGILCVILLYVSLPILNSHIALPGYADIWVSIYVALTIASLYHWNRRIRHWQLFLAISMILNCYLVKSQSGAVWACLLLLTLAISYLDLNKNKIYLAIITCITFCIMLVFIGIEIGDADGIQLVLTTDRLKVPYLYNFETPNIDEIFGRFMAIVMHLFWYSNWSLLWYTFLFLFLACMKRNNVNIPSSMIFFVISSLTIVVTYIVMANYISVSIDTVVNRGFLHIAAAYLLISSILVHKTWLANPKQV